MKKAKITKCPHCGSTIGLYTRYSYKNVMSFYSFDGKQQEESLDYAYTEGGKRMYCQDCDKYVCTIDNFMVEFEKEKK